VVRFSTSGALHETFVKEPAITAFALMLPGGEAPFRVRGRELQPGSITLLQPQTEYEVVSPAGGSTLEVYVPDELLASLGLERWLEPTLNVRPHDAAASALASRLVPLVTRDRRESVYPATDSRAVLEHLLAALDTVEDHAAPAPSVRLHQLYRRAIAEIEQEPDLMLTVAELAARLGVTTRTLRYAFGYAIGISPYQFMLRRRLRLVRDALLDPTRPEATVLALLLAFGISHQGEFARQYRRAFGESPVQTRARTVDRPSWRVAVSALAPGVPGAPRQEGF
jgi:AraC family ethanolamine operon transcriptional activator